jgi:hypothetical protein
LADLFKRAFRLVVGTTEIDARSGAQENGLRIAFSVSRDEKRTPNNAEIRVWNMSPRDRAALSKAESVSVSLEAGYVDDVGQIFLGDLRSVRHSHEQNGDIITTVCGGDGEANLRAARINRTFPAGTPVSAVLKGLASALGLAPGNSAAAAAALGTARLGKARTLSGLCYDELEAFCRTQGLRWSVQDSALQVRTEGLPVLPTTGPLLRNDSGLIGHLEVERNAKVGKDGKARGTIVSGTCLLRADIIPGVAFRVEGPEFQGNLVSTQTQHTGDSGTPEWFCHFSGRPYG